MTMKRKGLVMGAPKKHVPFHERHRNLLILCSLAGLHIRAVDRIFTEQWKRKLVRYWSILVHLVLSSVFTSSLLHLIFAKKTIYQGIHSMLIMGCSTHGVFRQYYMHKNIDKFDELYTTWDDLFGTDNDWKSRQESVDKHYKDAKKAIGSLGLGTTLMLTIYSIANLTAPDKIFRFPTILPYRHQSPDFDILVSYFSFGISWHAIAVGSSQMLLMTPIIWELGEITRLQKSLKEIFKNGESVTEEVQTEDGDLAIAKKYTKRGIGNIRKNMNVWVEQHQKLTKFHEMSMFLNNFELGMEMVATFIEACGMAIICSSDYMIPVDQMTTMAGFMGYFALFYYSCSKCNELSDLSMAVADDAFAENWSALPAKLKKNFLMIVARTLKPLNYYGAYVFRLDIMTFNQIFQTAYSVFNFFFTMQLG